MGEYVGIGKFNKKYIWMLLGAFCSYYIARYSYLLFQQDKNDQYKKREYKYEYKENNKLLKTLLKCFGFCLAIIGELIRKKLSKEEKKNYQVLKTKDKIWILIVSLLFLLDEFLASFLKLYQKLPNISFDEQYNTIQFIFLFITSKIIFKSIYYKHQYISIIFMIFFELFRSIVRIIDNKEDNRTVKIVIISFFVQLIRAMIDSLFYSFCKYLIEKKFFSQYKVIYIFGFIIFTIMIIIYAILTGISVNTESTFCFINYNNKCYLDNFFSIFTDFSFLQFLGLIFDAIFQCSLYIFFTFIISYNTICHVFPYYQFIAFSLSFKKNTTLILIFIVVSFIFEFFSTFVFLEIIILKCCGFNKNIKVNIDYRSRLDIESNRTSSRTLIDIDDSYIVDSSPMKEISMITN